MRPTEGNEVNRKEAREILLFTHTALLFVKEQLVKVAVPVMYMAPPCGFEVRRVFIIREKEEGRE